MKLMRAPSRALLDDLWFERLEIALRVSGFGNALLRAGGSAATTSGIGWLSMPPVPATTPGSSARTGAHGCTTPILLGQLERYDGVNPRRLDRLFMLDTLCRAVSLLLGNTAECGVYGGAPI